jgi:hypothetical protein
MTLNHGNINKILLNQREMYFLNKDFETVWALRLGKKPTSAFLVP